MINTQYTSLYIHFPFCRSKCPYCAFTSFPITQYDAESYVSLLQNEYQQRSLSFSGRGARSVYLGGGTPLLLAPHQLGGLFQFLQKNVVGSGTEEISIEATPSSITREKVAVLVNGGVTRVTLGMQSFDPLVLREIGREQELSHLDEAITILRDYGIDNIGLDIILGLPGERLANFSTGVQRLIKYGVSHVSAYFLKCEPGTLFGEQAARGEFCYLPDWKMRALYEILRRSLFRAGFEQYEIANFSLPGKESLHNSLTWEYENYAGLGVAAVGFDGRVRRTNPDTMEQYSAAVSDKTIVSWPAEQLSWRDRVNEKIMLSLRTMRGLNLSLLREQEGFDLFQEKRPQVEDLLGRGWLKIDDGYLHCSRKGVFWLDTILVELFI